MVCREEFRRAAFAGWERDQAKAEERLEAHPAEFPAEQAAGQAQDWDYPVSARDCSDLDQDQSLDKAPKLASHLLRANVFQLNGFRSWHNSFEKGPVLETAGRDECSARNSP
ncbi:hypothetical protein BQ8794_130259 [Mesorhizobium prunaredense]|uniref:Uncharacterized protein n=1 Tax=Mesorhizobium prunaredense TaxID=1631249 RepID=A0A1R3V4V6_9HYPH|nr:hypothetical protein [Mesorhizobium prunaredense]SIT53775.1 hypothetical protein BQ8794_130259 [Mesorhizobium prunaredense]